MSRAISMLLAVVVMLIGSIFPFVLAKQATGLNQGILLVVVIGMSGAFIHGTGLQPKSVILRWLASPAFAWPVIILGCGAMAALR